MLLTRSRPDWHIPENRITPERIATAPRRRVLGALAASLALAACDDSEATATGSNSGGPSNGAGEADPSASLYPFESNPDYVLPKPWTRFDLAAGYNNFTEFGSHKQIQAAAQALPIRPWTFTIDGMVEEPVTTCSTGCRSRNGSTVTAVSRHGRWSCHGAVSRCVI